MKHINRKVLFVSQFPLIFYIWLGFALTIILLLFIISESSDNRIITWLILTGLLYYILCRASCKIIIYEDEFIIKKIFGDFLRIRFEDLTSIDYKKGFFDFTAPINHSSHFKLICYDTLFVKLKTKNVKIDVNTRRNGFDMLLGIILKKLES